MSVFIQMTTSHHVKTMENFFPCTRRRQLSFHATGVLWKHYDNDAQTLTISKLHLVNKTFHMKCRCSKDSFSTQLQQQLWFPSTASIFTLKLFWAWETLVAGCSSSGSAATKWRLWSALTDTQRSPTWACSFLCWKCLKILSEFRQEFQNSSAQ